MLKQICALLLCAWLVLPLFSCQPTPNKDIVVNKNDGKLEEKLYATASPAAVESGTPSAQPTAYEAPERATGSFDGYGGRMDVQIDATVTLPNVDSIPVYSIKDRALSQREVDNIVEVLMGDRPLYYPDDTQTKADIELYIIQLKKELADLKSGIVDPIYDTPPTEEYYRNIIAEQEAAYAAAPESIDDVTVSTEEYGKMGSFAAKANFEDGRTAYLKTEEYSPLLFYIDKQYSDGGINREATDLGLSISKTEATNQAIQLVEKLGAKDMTPIAVTEATSSVWDEPAPSVYCITFSPLTSGIPINYMGLEMNDPYVYENNLHYSELITYELLRVFIGDEGVVSVIWNSAREIDETISENVELMPFEDIMQHFEQQMVSSRSYFMEEDALKAHVTYYVQDIKLGYLSMHKKNDLDTMLLIPVWCFYGGSICDDGTTDEELIEAFTADGRFSREEAEATFIESKERDIIYGAAQRDPNIEKYRPLLAINAIDGSNVPT